MGEPVGLPPLQLLNITELNYNGGSSRLQIHVKNSGSATWPGHDIKVYDSLPSGEHLEGDVFEELVLMPGETIVLESSELVPPTPHPPLSVCILLDPANLIPEEDDRLPGWTRGEYCAPLPDLAITDVVYFEERRQVHVTIQNIGEASIQNRNVDLDILLDGGERLEAPLDWWSNTSLEPGQSTILIWPEFGPEVREQMFSGYEVHLDPANSIAEEDEVNNQYQIPPGEFIRVRLNAVGNPGAFDRSQ